MKYYTIAFPGEFGQDVQETWNEDQIIKSYYTYWSTKMIEAGKGDDISREWCIEDWCVIHWAVETDRHGTPVEYLLNRDNV
jgi:hypothetical protein